MGKNFKHGMTNTRLFTIWGSMKERCYNPNHMGYNRYGERDIQICSEWLDKDNGFFNFYNWAIKNGYQENLSIDRINNEKGYSPENCRWATRQEQQRNTKRTIYIEHDNQRKTLYDWCDIFNAKFKTAYWRYTQGWPFEKLFNPPRELRRAKKQSGILGIIWIEKSKKWHVKGMVNNKPDIYIKSFKTLEEAIKFKEEYDLKNPYFKNK